MITLTRVTAEGMKGHVDYKVTTGRMMIDPATITSISELHTSTYVVKRGTSYPVVTTILTEGHQYNVTESYDEVAALIGQ